MLYAFLMDTNKAPKLLTDIARPLAIAYAEKFDVATYRKNYLAGYRATSSRRFEWDHDLAYGDGYHDAGAGREKWHLAYCSDHDNCG